MGCIFHLSLPLSPDLAHTMSRYTLSEYHTLQSATSGPIKDGDTSMARVARGLWNDWQSKYEQRLGFCDLPGRTWMILLLKSREQVPMPSWQAILGLAVQLVTWIPRHSALTRVIPEFGRMGLCSVCHGILPFVRALKLFLFALLVMSGAV